MVDRVIPKVIHYVWFGGSKLPELAIKCISSWRQVLPQYEIIRWDETNIGYNEFIKRCLDIKAYATASNYARLLALKMGGLYLDVDVEARVDISDMLVNDFIAGWAAVPKNDTPKINNAILAACPNNQFINHMLEAISTLNDMDASASGPECLTAELCRILPTMQPNCLYHNNGWAIYPKEYFYPYDWLTNFDESLITSDTVLIHHWMKSWWPNAKTSV